MPTGGRELFILNSEFRIPVPLKKGLGVVAFYDGGNVFEHVGFSDFGSNYTNTLGIGLRYATPIGPVRIDLGHNFNALRRNQINAILYHPGAGILNALPQPPFSNHDSPEAAASGSIRTGADGRRLRSRIASWMGVLLIVVVLGLPLLLHSQRFHAYLLRTAQQKASEALGSQAQMRISRFTGPV